MMHYSKNDSPVTLHHIEHAMGKPAQQSPAGTGGRIHNDLGGRLRFDPCHRASYREQEILRRADTPLTIPARCLRHVGDGFRREQNLHGYKPSCCRISFSATAQDTAESGFCR